jgi:hypothetical protein
VPGAVVLLVLPGLLVLADDVVLVVVHMHAAHDAHLMPPVHDEPVEIERRLGIPHQRAVGQEGVERRPALGVHAGVVRIGVGGQVDVGTPDVQEAPGVAGGECSRLLAVHDVVGDGSHLTGDRGRDAGRGTVKSHRGRTRSAKERWRRRPRGCRWMLDLTARHAAICAELTNSGDLMRHALSLPQFGVVVLPPTPGAGRPGLHACTMDSL